MSARLQFYKVTNEYIRSRPAYKTTFDEARRHVRAYPNHQWRDIYVDLVEIPTDKATLASMLNGGDHTETALATWHVSPRGALVKNAVLDICPQDPAEQGATS
jgi:hypothetical protein